MGAPMAGFGPMAWSPFPYGAPASPGVPSDMYVDLFNPQSVLGLKSWNVPSVGANDVMASFGVTGVPGSTLTIVNAGTASTFSPMLLGVATGALVGMQLRASGTTGSTTTPVMVFDSRIGASTSVANRPMAAFRNNGTEVIQITAGGGIIIDGGSAPSLKVGASGTAITQVRVYAPSLTPALVAANTSAEQTFTVAGLSTSDKVMVNSIAALGDGLAIVGVRVSAADTLAIRFANLTAGDLTPAAGVYPVVATRS